MGNTINDLNYQYTIENSLNISANGLASSNVFVFSLQGGFLIRNTLKISNFTLIFHKINNNMIFSLLTNSLLILQVTVYIEIEVFN